jgi:nicotinamidase-related amidase
MAGRIWDEFLTDQDKALLAALSPPHHPGFGSSCAVLSIDNYVMAVGDEPLPLLESVKTWPGSCGLAGWEALRQTAELFATARNAGVPVIHVTRHEDYYEIGATKPYLARYEPPQSDQQYRKRFDFVDLVAPIPGEMVIRKSSPSAFFCTPLHRYLLNREIDTLIVCGESASGCVRASVVDGDSNGFRIILAEECVYDRMEATRAINLFDMDQKYGEVMPLADILEYLKNR